MSNTRLSRGMNRCTLASISTLLLLMSTLISGCSTFDLIPSDSLIQRLKGRGPVLVSPDNPYLAANLLLQQESKQSEELAGFLETKGLPSALSVSQDFLSPATLKFFYQDSSEQYHLELLQGIWVIKGPSSINDAKAIELLGSSPSTEAPNRRAVITPTIPAQASVDEQPVETQKEIAVEPKQTQDLVPLFDENNLDETAIVPARRNKPAPIIIPAEEEKAAPERPTTTKSSSIDELIGRYASATAETTPRGDIVHYVTSENETLEKIAKWYTKSGLTLSRIARANKLEVTSPLSPGDQVVIPAELVKNKMRLPEEAIDSL